MKNIILKILLLVLLMIGGVQCIISYNKMKEVPKSNKDIIIVNNKNDKLILSDILIQLYKLDSKIEIDNINKNDSNTKIELEIVLGNNLDSMNVLVDKLKAMKYFSSITKIVQNDKELKKLVIVFSN